MRVPYPPTDNDPIPVKGGTLRYCLDNKKKKNRNFDLLYDLAFNPRVIDECCKDPLMFEMLKNLALDFTEDTLGMRINRDSVTKSSEGVGPQEDLQPSLDETMSHLLSKESEIGDSLFEKLSQLSCGSENKEGELPPLKLKQDNIASSNKPLIEEITAAPGSDPVADNQLKRPHYVLKENSDRTIIIDIQLNEVKSASDIDLEVSKVSKCIQS